jgi:hypothetical protein
MLIEPPSPGTVYRGARSGSSPHHAAGSPGSQPGGTENEPASKETVCQESGTTSAGAVVVGLWDDPHDASSREAADQGQHSSHSRRHLTQDGLDDARVTAVPANRPLMPLSGRPLVPMSACRGACST